MPAMRPVILALPGGGAHAQRLAERTGAELGQVLLRQFPDGEMYVRIDTPVEGRVVVLAASLDQAASKLLPLVFLAGAARDLGARAVGLAAPYLSFMRQDSRFHAGEGVTSRYFAALLSSHVDWLVTVDPHLHRWPSLGALYTIPTTVAHAAPAIAAWLRREVARPVIVGPDAESAQWAAVVAAECDAPCVVLEKTRRGDRDVSVTTPDLSAHLDRTPVVVDDIISTARTMIEATGRIRAAGGAPPLCVGIHAVFADTAYEDLLAAGAIRVVTTNTIEHPSNLICVADALAAAVGQHLG